ncbi:MAG: AAA family ATPase [Dissulfuribacterales bacterium]
MYNQFFGFKDRPFKLVPNPDYLFLSKSHEEALAHLKYAVSDGEGFVEIIGEVGTGKTMLCRAFLENLDPDTESAYIFNPRMDAIDLLRSINDEFGIASDHDSTKALIDVLNTFLIEKKAAGQKVILLIDEVQNLSREVLEQVRLLSNLETTKDKLLQIILVGQPELGDMLDSYELRQLGQRVSLSCWLQALTYSETRKYIAHRIHVAAQKPVHIFTAGAIRKIYKFSRGIPRLINIACDRALLTAYARHRKKVTASIAESAIRELATRGEINRQFQYVGNKRLFALSFLCVVLVLGLLVQPDIQSDIWGLFGDVSLDFNHRPPVRSDRLQPVLPKSAEPVETNQPQKTLTAQPLQSQQKILPEAKKYVAASPALEEIDHQPGQTLEQTSLTRNPHAPVDFRRYLIATDAHLSKIKSFQYLLQQWETTRDVQQDFYEIDDDMAFFYLAAHQNGLIVTPVDADLQQIMNLNLPAVLTFNHPENFRPVYLTVISVTPDEMIFSGNEDGRPVAVTYADVIENWSGTGYVFWKNFYNYRGTIPLTSLGESVITLKLHLRDIGYPQIKISGTYDLETQTAIKDIQAKHHIPVDGYVGPLTKIVLYNEKSSLVIPHLWDSMSVPVHVQIPDVKKAHETQALINNMPVAP